MENKVELLGRFLEGRAYDGLRRQFRELADGLRDEGRLVEADIVDDLLGCPCDREADLYPARCPLHGAAWAAGHKAGAEREGW